MSSSKTVLISLCRARLLAAGFAAIVTLGLAACGPKEESMKLYPVRGKVMLNDKPTEGALVTLYAQNSSSTLTRPPTAYVKQDGSFAVGTMAPEDGAPPGEYKVAIQWLPADARSRMVDGGTSAPNQMPPVYGDPLTSGLSITVKEQPNDVPPFQLKGRTK